MSDFPSGAICVVGLAKVANQNPIHSVHRALAGSFIVDPSSGLVYDVQFDTVCQITSDFLASLLIGLSLHTDLEEMISRVQSRYFGDSRRDSEGSGYGAPSPAEGAMALRLTAAPPSPAAATPLPLWWISSLTSPTTTVSCPSEPLSSRGPSDHFDSYSI